MKYGFMTPANESGKGILADIATHPTKIAPEVVVIWARYNGVGKHFRLDWRLLEQVRALGMEPVIFAETHPMTADDILLGVYDDAFRLLAARSRGAAIRIFHEANGSGTFYWQKWPVFLFIEVWQRVARIFHEEGARIIYCVVARGKRNDDMFDRYPGDEYVDIVAFDEFRRSDKERLPPEQWAWIAARLGVKGKPVWVCETGAEASTTARGLWMRSLGRVVGIAVILIFDFRIVFKKLDGTTQVDNWLWNKGMDREFDLLPRAA